MKFTGVPFDKIENGKMYMVSGFDTSGKWSMNATAKFYKPGSTKKQMQRKFRFLDSNNCVVFGVEHVDECDQ